jgi:large subunit ribosomal protein L24e
MLASTVKAMKRVQEIKARRERIFAKKRYMKGIVNIRLITGLEKQKQDNLKQVEMHVELLTGQSLKDKMKTTIIKEQRDMELA